MLVLVALNRIWPLHIRDNHGKIVYITTQYWCQIFYMDVCVYFVQEQIGYLCTDHNLPLIICSLGHTLNIHSIYAGCSYGAWPCKAFGKRTCKTNTPSTPGERVCRHLHHFTDFSFKHKRWSLTKTENVSK